MGWLRSLVCFLSRSNTAAEGKEGREEFAESGGGGGGGMAPYTRSKSRTSAAKLAAGFVDTKLESAGREGGELDKDRAGFRGSKRQRVKEDITGVCL